MLIKLQTLLKLAVLCFVQATTQTNSGSDFTKADELAEQALPAGNRPTSRAIRMANALMLEQLLGTGQFASASELARCIGVQKHLLSDLLALLNMPVPEIEKWLFETY